MIALQGDGGSSQQNGGPLGGLFGGRSKSSPDAPVGPQKQKKIGAKLVDAKPVGKQVGQHSVHVHATYIKMQHAAVFMSKADSPSSGWNQAMKALPTALIVVSVLYTKPVL